MAQTQNEHLTTEQISASFDKQLSPQDQAVFDAHLSSCQQCQHTLSDLQLTATLLHSMPVEEVPRSFVLPDNVSILPDRTMRQDAPVTALPQRQRPQRSVLRRSVRVVSTLAAVLALCFIISGMLPLLFNSAGNSASSTASSSTMAPVDHGAATPGVNQPNNVFPAEGSAATTPPTETTHSLTPNSKATVPSSSDHSTHQGQSPAIPPFIDFSQPLVRLGAGALVLAVSIIVLIVTRRRRVALR
ncbi:MAG: anti-sigma factor family protein [Ktedonobacteraceae bacterium]